MKVDSRVTSRVGREEGVEEREGMGREEAEGESKGDEEAGETLVVESDDESSSRSSGRMKSGRDFTIFASSSVKFARIDSSTGVFRLRFLAAKRAMEWRRRLLDEWVMLGVVSRGAKDEIWQIVARKHKRRTDFIVDGGW